MSTAFFLGRPIYIYIYIYIWWGLIQLNHTNRTQGSLSSHFEGADPPRKFIATEQWTRCHNKYVFYCKQTNKEIKIITNANYKQ
jgi:hypothetical protein